MLLEESLDYALKMSFLSVHTVCILYGPLGYCIFSAADFVCWSPSGSHYAVVFTNKVDVYKLEVQFFIFLDFKDKKLNKECLLS